MNDPITTVVRVLMLLFVPAMLLFPLVVALIAPMRVTDDTGRMQARSRLALLVLATLVALGIWGGLLLASIQLPNGMLPTLAQFSWVLFFPLWFACAMPAIRAKNPVWSGALEGAMATDSPVRTASLVNRPRENPISPAHWAIAIAVVAAPLIAIALRGLWPFENTHEGHAAIERTRWLVALAVYAFCALTTFIVAPISIAKLHVEPEPLDPSGSPALIALYRVQRLRKARGLFWMLVVVLPGFLGGILAAGLWLPPGYGGTIGLLGAIGGSAIGLLGGVFGTMMAFQRVRLAEMKSRLETAGASN